MTTRTQDVGPGAPAEGRLSGWPVAVLLCALFYAASAHAQDQTRTETQTRSQSQSQAPTQDGAAPEERRFQVWLNPGIYSYHFDSSKDLRNNNIGFGAEVLLARDHVVMGGTFINSNDARTRYAAYEWRPLHWQLSGLDVGLGILVGAFDGYPNYRDGGWFVAPLPMLSVEGKTFGANISLIPTVENRFDGAISIQVKLRVW